MKPAGRRRPEHVSLDLANARLQRGGRAITLRPKDFTVLQQLVAHQGQRVTKSALLRTAWPDVFVSDAVLKVSIRRLRAALGDDARGPRFIETRHRLGYCLVGKIALVDRRPTGARPPGHTAVPRPPVGKG